VFRPSYIDPNFFEKSSESILSLFLHVSTKTSVGIKKTNEKLKNEKQDENLSPDLEKLSYRSKVKKSYVIQIN